MTESIHIFWGPDKAFEEATKNLEGIAFLSDVLSFINRTEMSIRGLQTKEGEDEVLERQNLIISTDDYGGLREWALLGFTKNILENLKVEIKHVWLNNHPQKIYDDIRRNNTSDKISEKDTKYPNLLNESLKLMATTYSDSIIGQEAVMKHIITALYSLNHADRERPITLLFLGDSGVGKTETAKFIGKCLEQQMVRIQFSMQQTTYAYQFIFGAEHGENSLARELIRRESNVVLLDEFDKVSPAFYNAFYQMFDEGWFVDANYKVDVRKSIIICTSNFLCEEDAEKYLGAPIYSRFSKVIKFSPLSVDDRIKIAERRYSEILSRLSEEDRELITENPIMKDFIAFIRSGQYTNMRMLKNDVEEAVNYHVLKAKGILN